MKNLYILLPIPLFMDLNLRDKLIFVTGAAGGLGSEIVRSLKSEGAYPMGIDVNPLDGSELEKKLDGKTDNFHFFCGDCSSLDFMEEVQRESVGLYGNSHVWGLVNCAGLGGGDKKYGGERTLRNLDLVLRSHLHSAVLAIESFYPRMNVGASIVNIGSIEIDMTSPEMVIYTTAKNALLGMTVAYAVTLAPKGIRVNMVSPGLIEKTGIQLQLQTAARRELTTSFERRTPLGRSVYQREVADAVIYFLSNRSSMITGENLHVDGGYTRAAWDSGWIKGDIADVYKPV